MARVDDKTAAEVGRAVLSLLELVGPRLWPRPPLADELVAFPFGLERAAAAALERRGELRVTKIGRRKYALRSEVLALIDTLAPKQQAHATARDPRAAYLALVGGER